MKDINEICNSSDKNEIQFYLDYVEQLIEMFDKRGKQHENLIFEQEVLRKKLSEFEF